MNGDKTQNTVVVDPGSDESQIVVDPIISKVKLSSYIDNFTAENSLPALGLNQKNSILNGGFENFSNYVKDYSYFSGKPIPKEEELNTLYNSFRDLEAEEIQRNKLKADYILTEAKKNKLENIPGVNLPEEADATIGLNQGDLITENEKITPISDAEIRSVQMDKFDRMALNQTNRMIQKHNEKIQKHLGINISDETIKIYNENDIWQNLYKVNSAKSNSNNPEFDYSFKVNGAFGQSIDGLGVEFIFNDAINAAQTFNKKFNIYGLSAEPKSVSAGPFGEAKESILILDENGDLMFEQRLFSQGALGIDKQTLVEWQGTPLDEEVNTGFFGGSVIRPELYTQEFTEFKMLLTEQGRNRTPILNLAARFSKNNNIDEIDEWQRNVPGMFILRDAFLNMTELSHSHNNMIVRIGNVVGLDIRPSDMFDMNKSITNEPLYDPMKVQQWLKLIRSEVNKEDDTPGKRIVIGDELDMSVQMDKQGGLTDTFQYQYDFGVNSLESLNAILNLDAGINDILVDQYGNEHTKKDLLNKVLDFYSRTLRGKQNTASRNIGLALRINNNYKAIPIDGPTAGFAFSALSDMGMNISDHMPTDGITIDGRPSTYEEMYNIITDPTLNNEVRMNRIKVDIGNPEDYGVMSPVVERAQALFDRNETSFLDSAGELWGIKNEDMLEFLNATDRTANWFEDVLQGTFISMLDISASVKEIMKDKVRMMGVDDDVIDNLFSAHTVLMAPNSGLGLANPWLGKEEVERLREDYLPLWSTNITDFDSATEFLALANQPFAQSIPYVAAFMLNPKLGLAVVGVNSYGENIYGYRQRIEAAKQMDEMGLSLAETEINMMNTSDWAVRGLSLGQASIETAFTAMFTMQYFKQFAWMKGKTPKHLMNRENARKMAEQYSMRFDKGFQAELNRLWKIEGGALWRENIEEGNIALWSYVFESAMGLQEYDHNKAWDLLKETTYVTSFSSLGMAGGLRLSSSINLENSASIMIEENLGNGSLYTLVDQNLNVGAALSKYVANQKKQGKTKNEIENSNFYLWAQTFLKNTQSSIKKMEADRSELVRKLTKEDKIRFLDHLSEITKLESIVNSTAHTDYTRIESNEKIREHQFELSKIVSNIGDATAFEFLHFSEKASYITDAYMETNYDEWLKLNKNGNKEGWENAVYEKAIQKYIDDVKERKEKNQLLPSLDLWTAPAYGNTDPNSIISLDIDPEYSKTFDLTTELKNASNNLINQVTTLFDPAPVKESITEEDGKKVERIIPPEMIELKGKVQDIIDKINSFNLTENNQFMNNLNKFDQDFIKKFFQSINKPKEGQALISPRDYALQRVSSIVEAYSIAQEISSKIDSPIDIFPEGALKGLYKTFAGDYSGLMRFLPKDNAGKRNIATLDILKNLLIRDKTIAKPFLDLYGRTLQKIAESKSKTEGLYLDLLNTYFQGKGEAPTSRSITNLWLTKNKKSVSIEDDYEMSILSGLGRVNLDLSKGATTEFTRYKNNLLQELEARKNDMQNASSKNKREATGKYNILKKVIEKLNIESATSYEQVLKHASKHNIDVVEQIRELFKGMEKDSKDRVYGFGQKWTNFENYMPLFLRPIEHDGSILDEMQYENSTNENAGKINTTGSLQYATVPDSYINEGWRLNLGDYMKNSFHALKGTTMDANARQDVMTMVNLFNSPLFKKQFSDPGDFETFKNLFGDHFLRTFNYEVNQGRNPYTDYGDNNILTGDAYESVKKKTNMVVNSTLSVASATALSSLTQPTQQFYSAISNNMLRVSSPEAKWFLAQKMALFPIGLAGISNGTKNKGYTLKLIQDVFGQGDKSNIYSKSRTSLRNAIQAELPLEQNALRDVSYYATTLGVDLGKHGFKGSYTFDQFFRKVQQNSELSLEIFLARADKAAANASFEAHYLDFRIKNGAEYPGDSKGRMAWWKNENENPNKDAITYADALVAELMRPSGDMSEAGIYKSDQGFGTKTFLRTFMPFAKFSLNAKTNYWVQYAIANDQTVPAEQRADARTAMAGILSEISTFQGIKITMQSALYGTLASTVLGFDDDEIERIEGGLHGILKNIHLPLDDANFMKNLHKAMREAGVEDMNSLEAINAYTKVYMQDAIGDDAVTSLEDLQNYGRTYSDKTNLTPKNSNVFQAIVQDVIRTMNPVVVPEFVNTGTFAIINHIARENNIIDEESNIFLEYASEDMFSDKISTGEKFTKFVTEHLGLYGIVGDQAKKVLSSIELMNRNSITKTFRGVEQTQYVGTGNVIVNEKIDKALGTLAMLRILVATGSIPGAPSAEITRYLDRLERGLEMHLNTTESLMSGNPQGKPDPQMLTGWSRYWETLEEQRLQKKDPKNR